MSNKTQVLPQPTSDLVVSYIQKFDQSQAIVERVLSKLFATFPENVLSEDVLLKVVVLNDLYRTGILATGRVAEHICQIKIDAPLKAGEPQLVHRIAHVQIRDKQRNNYSFATKYCAWHQPDHFPIFDSFVEQMLWTYRRQGGYSDFMRQDLWKYEVFMQAIVDFRNYYGLMNFALKDIDKFLWLAGNDYFPRAW